MAANNPQIEKMTIWGFTEEEIIRRWKVSEFFSVVNRLFGSSSDSDNEAAPAKDQPVNSPQLLSILERLLPSQGESDNG